MFTSSSSQAMSSTDALKKPSSSYFLWFNANREKISSMVGSKDFKSVAAKASELWKKASPAEKSPFEKEAKRQKDAYDAFVATEEGQKALQEKKDGKKEEKQAKSDKDAEKEKLKQEKQVAREIRECSAAVKAVEKDEKLKRPMTAYFMWLGENRERIAGLAGSKGSEVTKKGAEMWKQLSDKEKKPVEDRAKKAKEEYDAYLATPEGAAALKAYKEATSAVAYKEKVADKDEEVLENDASKGNVTKRKLAVVSDGAVGEPKKMRLANAGS